MADTIVTNSPGTNDSGAAGWVAALAIIVALVVGGIFLYQRGVFSPQESADTTNINVTVPTPTTDSKTP